MKGRVIGGVEGAHSHQRRKRDQQRRNAGTWKPRPRLEIPGRPHATFQSRAKNAPAPPEGVRSWLTLPFSLWGSGLGPQVMRSVLRRNKRRSPKAVHPDHGALTLKTDGGPHVKLPGKGAL